MADLAISTDELVRLDVRRPQSSRVGPLSLFTAVPKRLHHPAHRRMLPVLHLSGTLVARVGMHGSNFVWRVAEALSSRAEPSVARAN